MKSIFIFLFLIVCFISCKKQTTNTCFQIKYIDGMCYTNVYQIVTPSFQHLGQPNWVRQTDGKPFKNVFVLENYCEDINFTFNTLDSTYTVRLLNSNETKNTNCITCQAAYNNPPSKSLAVKPTQCNE